MIDRLRGFLPPRIVERSRDWEGLVSNSLRILRFQMQLAEEAKKSDNFQAEEHAKRVRGRIGNLKDLVIDTAAKENSISSYPEFLAVESDRTYFYIPDANKLISANEQVIARGVGGFISVPDLTSAIDIDEKTWCLDKALVGNIAKGIINLLPRDSSRRILSQPI